MTEGVSLAPLTTFGIGGEAKEFLEIRNEEDIRSAASHARRAFAVLGGGSNVLVPDAGIEGVVLKIAIPGITFEVIDDLRVRVIAGAGVSWDELVQEVSERSLWGIENLAGIPGTVGGAVVQNIGAYGAELKDAFEYADVFNLETGAPVRLAREDARFAYRDSAFKHGRSLVVMRAVFVLQKKGTPNLDYRDMHEASLRGTLFTTPLEIALAVRTIRAGKFPDLSREGTAGSFFKNPLLSQEQAAELSSRFPQMPQFPQADGTVKISLAWLLDHALGMKGYAMGKARLFEKQPLVIVAAPGARANDVENLARDVEEKVFQATGIKIEREVENFSERKLSTARE